MSKMFSDTREIVDDFVSTDDNKRTDYLKRENSNFVYGLPLLRKNISNFAEEEYLMTKIFPKELVQSYYDGHTYIHDKQLSSYCQSISCKDIAERGIPTIAKNMTASAPTKRLRKLFRHFSNVVVLMSQQVSGAVMLAQMTTVLASYLYYDKINNIHIWNESDLAEEMQSLIWELNMPLRSGSESAFSNCTLEFGKPSEEIKNDYVVIGGEYQSYKYSEIPSEYFDRINKAFIDVMAKGTGCGIPFTFPLISIQIDDNFKFDNPMFLYFLNKMYYFNGAYFENFRTKPFENSYYKKLNPCLQARDPSVSRSLCPLDGNQKVLYYDDYHHTYLVSKISEVYRNTSKKNYVTKIISNGKLINARVNKFNSNNFFTITLSNGAQIRTTQNHLNKTLRGNEIRTDELTTEDYLPFSRKVIEGNGLTKEDGMLVGAFLGDGSFDSKNSRIITYSLNVDTDNEFKEWLEKYTIEHFGAYTNEYLCTSKISGNKKCVNVRINSVAFYGFIKQFVKGHNALDKELNLCVLQMSKEFREGIIKGLYQTDGGNNNRIYTSSEKLKDSFTTMLMSLGIPSRIDKDIRKERLSNNPCYIIRLYQPNDLKTKYENVYKMDNDYFWFKIKSIAPYNKNFHNGDYAYCFEILDNNEPVFSLSNGIVTHNCRLQISLSTIKGLSSGGIFGSSIGNVGAIQVIDINMNRLMLECGNNIKEIENKMDYYLELIEQGHMAKRKWIENHKELYPTFFAFNNNLKNYFNVFGCVGMHEGLINIGYDGGITNPEGKKFAHQLMQHMRKIIDGFIIRDNVACGIEASPAENAGIKLARNDLKYAKSIGKRIFVQGKGEDVYLTSGCMTPFSEDNFDLQIENSAEFQGYFTSGSILHQFIESKIEPEKLAKYLSKLFEKPIIYTTLSPTLSSCMDCGAMFIGADAKTIEKCPKCGSDDIATFSRVIGYTKMIARKGIKIAKDGLYKGKYNFWSKARRYDWTERKRIKTKDVDHICSKDKN